MHDGWMSWNGHGGMWLGPIFWLVILAVAVWLAVSLLRRDDGWPGQRRQGTPRDILDERFARGDIDEDEYKRRRDMLDA